MTEVVATGVAIAMLAEELGFEYYDREIIEQIAEHTSFSEEYIHQIVEGRRRQTKSGSALSFRRVCHHK